MTRMAKLDELRGVLSEMPGAVVAYSGGVDSAFLAHVVHEVLGEASLMVTADSPSLPRAELDEAMELARERSWNHRVVGTDELADENYASNPTNRCYFCKSALFDVLRPIADELGWEVLLGTNLDDLGDWRPGHVAAEERGVKHPLVVAGLSKADVRLLSRKAGLPTADKPAAACLASRFAYGVRVTQKGLGRVERAERLLKAMGFDVVRVRDLGDDHARVEVGPAEVNQLLEMSTELGARLRTYGFASIEIDPEGYRRGSLNEGVVASKIGVGPPRMEVRP